MSDDAGYGDAPPIFIGGAPRSGTHAVAHLLSRHSRYAMIKQEMRIQSVRYGLIGLLEGRLAKQDIVEELPRSWWKRQIPWEPERTYGLYKSVAREDFDAAAQAFASIDDPVEASRALMRGMADPIAARAGKAGWIEHSPNNTPVADTLVRIFPEAKFINVVRDARDRACSVLPLPWGPTTHEGAIDAWEVRVRGADRAMRSLPAGQVLVVQFEDLVLLEREGSYRRLFEFAGLEPEPANREFFDREVTVERAHVGRWREEIPSERRGPVTAYYGETLARMRADGVACTPPLYDFDVSHARDADEPENPFDPWSDGRGLDI
jgi:hypothetical protein